MAGQIHRSPNHRFYPRTKMLPSDPPCGRNVAGVIDYALFQNQFRSGSYWHYPPKLAGINDWHPHNHVAKLMLLWRNDRPGLTRLSPDIQIERALARIGAAWG